MSKFRVYTYGLNGDKPYLGWTNFPTLGSATIGLNVELARLVKEFGVNTILNDGGLMFGYENVNGDIRLNGMVNHVEDDIEVQYGLIDGSVGLAIKFSDIDLENTYEELSEEYHEVVRENNTISVRDLTDMDLGSVFDVMLISVNQ